MDPLAVYKAKNELMANTIRDLLLQHGIGAMIRSFLDPRISFAPMASPFDDYSGMWGEVLVNSEDLESAFKLIADFTSATDGPNDHVSDAELEALALAAPNPETDA